MNVKLTYERKKKLFCRRLLQNMSLLEITNLFHLFSENVLYKNGLHKRWKMD